MVINRRIKRKMIEHKSIYLVSIALIILSSAMFTLFNTTGPAIKDTIENFKKDYKVEDSFFTTSMPIEDISKLEDKFDVTIEEIKWKDIKVLDKVNLRIYKEREKVDLYQVVKGEGINSPGDIVVNEDFYKVNGLKFNDTIKAGNQQFLLKGVSTSPDNIYMLENSSSVLVNKQTFAIGFVSNEDFDKIENPNVGYSVKYNKDNSSREEFKRYIQDNYFLLSFIDKEHNTKITAIDGDLNGMFALGQYTPIVIIILVSLIISIVVAKTIKSELTQLGTLFALGYKKSILIKHYIIYPTAISIIGGLIGQLPASFGNGFIISMLDVEYSLPKIVIEPNIIVIILSILIPILIIVPINFIIICKTLNHSAVDLMKGNLKDEGPGFLEKKIKFKRLSFKNRFKLKDIIRNFGRTFLTIFAICFCGMLLFLTFVMNESMDGIIKNGYEEAYGFKNLYIMSNITNKDTVGEKFWKLEVDTEDKNNKDISINLEGREKDSKLINLHDEEDNSLNFKDNIITSSLASKLGVKEGDVINVKSELYNADFKIKIDKIADYYTSETIYIPIDLIYENTNIPKDSYIGIVSNEDINFNDGELASSVTKSALIAGAKKMITPLKGVMLLIGGIAAFIGIAMIYVIVSMVIEENRMNISMFKIMGYQEKNINKIIINVNDILVLIGFIISIPVSKFALTSLFDEVTKSMDFSLRVVISPSSIVIVFLILLFIYQISKMLSRRKILKVSMQEVLSKGRE